MAVWTRDGSFTVQVWILSVMVRMNYFVQVVTWSDIRIEKILEE